MAVLGMKFAPVSQLCSLYQTFALSADQIFEVVAVADRSTFLSTDSFDFCADAVNVRKENNEMETQIFTFISKDKFEWKDKLERNLRLL